MVEFQEAWAVVLRDLSPVEGEEADVVTVLKVFWSETEARDEVLRLREADPNEGRFYCCEATEVARKAT